MVGYMPRPMPWCFEEKLNVLGNSLVNTKPDATYHLDLRLLTSASPKAANNFRRWAKNTLINALGQKLPRLQKC